MSMPNQDHRKVSDLTPLERARVIVSALHQASADGTTIALSDEISGELELARTIAIVSIAESLEKLTESIGRLTIDKRTGRLRTDSLVTTVRPSPPPRSRKNVR